LTFALSLKVSFEDGIARTVDWYKFFFSVIYPGGNVGSQVAPIPNPFAPIRFGFPQIDQFSQKGRKLLSSPSQSNQKNWKPAHISLIAEKRISTQEEWQRASHW
jgi:hypothetical protein